MPKVSVVIATYNRAGLLMEAVASVLSQTFSDLEVIVVDDGSTDQTSQALERFLAARPEDKPRVRYIWQENRGQVAAANRGIELSTGEWVAFLDSDDRWLPEKLAMQLETLGHFELRCDACVTDTRYLNSPSVYQTSFEHVGNPYPGSSGMISEPLKLIAGGWHGLYVQTLLIRREVLPKIGGFDPGLRMSYDLDFLFRIAAHCNICYVNKPLVEVDRTPNRPDGMIERFQDEKFRLEHYQHLNEKWLEEDQRSDLGVSEVLRSQLQQVHMKWASWYLLNGDRQGARRAMSTAMRYKLTGRATSKWLLVALAPKLARKVVANRRENALEVG